MKLSVILVRHGEREKKKDICDKHAPLTLEGEQSTGKVAEFLSKLKLEFNIHTQQSLETRSTDCGFVGE